MGIESLLTETAPTAAMLCAAVWVLWQKVASIDEHTSERLDGIRESVDKLRGQVDEQNGRVSALERWRVGREGYRRGWGDHETQAGGDG